MQLHANYTAKRKLHIIRHDQTQLDTNRHGQTQLDTIRHNQTQIKQRSDTNPNDNISSIKRDANRALVEQLYCTKYIFFNISIKGVMQTGH